MSIRAMSECVCPCTHYIYIYIYRERESFDEILDIFKNKRRQIQL